METKKILFAPGLYKDMEELDFFNVEYFSESNELPSYGDYMIYFVDKLEKILVTDFANTIRTHYDEDELPLSLAYAEIGGNEPFSVSDLVNEWSKAIEESLENIWAIDKDQIYSFDTTNASYLADALVSNDPLNTILSNFYDRIATIKEGNSLAEYYLEQEYIYSEDEYLKSTLQELPDRYYYEPCDFEAFSYVVMEKR